MEESQRRHQAEKARFNKPSFQEHRQAPKHLDTSTTSHEPPSLLRSESFMEPPRKIVPPTEETRPVPNKPIWQRMEMGTPQQDQIKNKEKLVKTQTTAIDQQNLMLNLFEKIQPNIAQRPDQRNEVNELIKLAKDSIRQQQEQIEKTQAELAQSKQVATHYSPSLQKPALYEFTDMTMAGVKQALQAKNIRAAIETFNPDKDKNADFTDTWRQVLLYTQNFKLDEAAYINILTILVQGSASRILYEMTQGKQSLNSILQTMGDLYSKRRTIVDDMNDLNNFKRRPHEAIHTAMQRAKVMAERVRHLWPTTIWETNKKMEVLLSILRQIITPETKRHLEYEETKYWKTGTILEYGAMLDLVETYEAANDQVPKNEQKLIINVCTGTPKTNYKHNTSKAGAKSPKGNNSPNKNNNKNNKKVGGNNAEPMDVEKKKNPFEPNPVEKGFVKNGPKKRKIDIQNEKEKKREEFRDKRKGDRPFKRSNPRKLSEAGNVGP